MMQLEQELRKFIVDNFLFGKEDGQLRNDDSFLEKGLIDSTGMTELVSHLEHEYHIKLEDDELVPDNLDSIEKLAGFVSRKKKLSA